MGWPVEHSKSPAMMNAAFAATGIDAEMIRVGVPPDQFAAKLAALRALPMLGASITIPHKLAAHDRCDELTPAARAIGAVNCLALADGKLIGHNTDAPGFVDAASAAGITLANANTILLGAGARMFGHKVKSKMRVRRRLLQPCEKIGGQGGAALADT